MLSTRPYVRRRGAVPRVASCVCVRSFPPRGRQPLLSPGSLRTVEPRADGETEEEEHRSPLPLFASFFPSSALDNNWQGMIIENQASALKSI